MKSAAVALVRTVRARRAANPYFEDYPASPGMRTSGSFGGAGGIRLNAGTRADGVVRRSRVC